MAKKKNWFDRVKRFFGSDTRSKQEKKERRRRWLFGRIKSKSSTALPAPPLSNAKSLREAEEEQSRHAMAVAVATAVAADAAVAAAQAAVQAVRLGGNHLSYHNSREIASIKIQTTFRGYLARKALRALQGLVRLQALIRGQTVRRQTSITLRSLQSLIKIQSEACATRVRMVDGRRAFEDKNIVHGKTKKSGDMRATQNSERRWDGTVLSKEEMDSILISRFEAALKRERAMEYASSHQERRNLRRPTSPTAKETNVPNNGWSWLDEWAAAQPFDKDIPENPTPSPVQDLHDQPLHASDSVVLLEAVHKARADETQLRYLERRSFSRSRRMSVRDDDSFTSSPGFPSYMASTESTKARFRSMSTPKQRLGASDTLSEYCGPFTNRLLSPLPSVVSEAGLGRTGRSPMFHHRSSGLKGQKGPVKSRRSSKYLSFDSECTLLNWDRHNAFR